MATSEIVQHMEKMTADQYKAIGLVAAWWSRFEADVATMLWRLTGLESGLGACLTAQIPNVSRLLDGLVALVAYRGGSKELLTRLNKFKAKTHGLVERRNRVVHDVWTFDPPGPVRHEVTAKGKLIWEYRAEPAATVDALATEIALHTAVYYSLAREIYAALLQPAPAKPKAARAKRGTSKKPAKN